MTNTHWRANQALGLAESAEIMASERDAILSNPPEAMKKVMVVHPVDDDLPDLLGILHRCGCKVKWWTRLADVTVILRNISIPVVICEGRLPDGTWRDLQGQVNRMACPSVMIVASRLADDHLWAEVWNLGGYDLLMKPFDAGEVVRVVNLAYQWWLEYRFMYAHYRRSR